MNDIEKLKPGTILVPIDKFITNGGKLTVGRKIFDQQGNLEGIVEQLIDDEDATLTILRVDKKTQYSIKRDLFHYVYCPCLIIFE